MKSGALWDHSRHWLNLRPIYAFGEWVLDSMPLFVGYGITRGVSELAYRFSPQQRAAIEGNLRQALRHTRPEMDERDLERQVRRLVHRIFVNRGVWFADLSLMAGRRQMKELFQFHTIGEWGDLERQLATGKGAIIASAHLGNWHGGGVALSWRGLPVRVVMYRNHAGNEMDLKVARRGNVRQTFIDSDPLSMVEIVRSLRSGELLAMLVDKPWDSRSVAVPFFGKSSLFPVGPVRLARLADVPIFPAFCVWKKTRQYEAILCDPIRVEAGDPDQAERAAVTRIARVIEEQVARNLSVWFNFTPAWTPA